MEEETAPTNVKVDFLVWLKSKGFVVDDMENRLDDTWKPFSFSFTEEGTTVTVEWQAKRGLDATKADEHTLVTGVKIINQPKSVAKVTQTGEAANLGPIRRSEVDPHPFKKYPRNMKCFCGSGKKFKVCHLEQIPEWTLKKDTPRLKAMYEAFLGNFAGREEQIKAVADHIAKTEPKH